MSETATEGASAGPGSVVHLDGVGLSYAKTRALDAITLDLPAGCMVGLIGPDGVGKSSLLALIAGAREIQEGRILALGGDMASARHRRTARSRRGPRRLCRVLRRSDHFRGSARWP